MAAAAGGPVHGKSMLRSRAVGIGSSAPSTVMPNSDLEELVETSDEWIATRTGIRKRHLLKQVVLLVGGVRAVLLLLLLLCAAAACSVLNENKQAQRRTAPGPRQDGSPKTGPLFTPEDFGAFCDAYSSGAGFILRHASPN